MTRRTGLFHHGSARPPSTSIVPVSRLIKRPQIIALRSVAAALSHTDFQPPRQHSAADFPEIKIEKAEGLCQSA